ncbi:probable peptidyl-tRNA hydrolase 2 [Daktulosphaira vitifoliae]|uniref:probable peptidyl-tRNA hydrolase 2 n=1 Tax=Daktulosphaira vitifoliae TaxID=58002 RepID=UPI0021AA9209|nr:probable peptidyl-tRNA hydrolase 2 [Daktulosphaira vitifoliae]
MNVNSSNVGLLDSTKHETDVETKIIDNNQQKEITIQELIEMGFPKTDVIKLVEAAGNISKDLIIEQLLLHTNSMPSDSIPVVDDDGDILWEDVEIPYKMVIVINVGLKMSIGKIASQAAHAALGLYEIIKGNKNLKHDFQIWDEQGSRKIVLEAKNTSELIKLCNAGKLHCVPYYCVHDAGLTEIASNSFTALAFFGSNVQLKPITGKLKLLK